jgi:hypothetical protein
LGWSRGAGGEAVGTAAKRALSGIGDISFRPDLLGWPNHIQPQTQSAVGLGFFIDEKLKFSLLVLSGPGHLPDHRRFMLAGEASCLEAKVVPV